MSIYSSWVSLYQIPTVLQSTLDRLSLPCLSFNPLPAPFKAIARGFVILFHVRIWSPSTIFSYFHLLHSPFSLSQVPPHCTYFIGLSFIFNSKVNIQRGFSMYPSCEFTLLWSVQPPLLFSLNPSLPLPIINSFQCIFYVLYLHRYSASRCCWLSIILFSFPSSSKCTGTSLKNLCIFLYDHYIWISVVFHQNLLFYSLSNSVASEFSHDLSPMAIVLTGLEWNKLY
jgi:hypothetical protein